MNPYPKPERRAKKTPKPLKRTKIKPITKPLKKMSAKQAANLLAYTKGKAEKYGDGQNVCSGCGTNYGLTCSHLVARSHSFELVAEKLNHECQCHNCHDLTERGQYYQLKNGLALLERLWCGLGEAGKRRFYYVINQHPQNFELWQHSQFFDTEIF